MYLKTYCGGNKFHLQLLQPWNGSSKLYNRNCLPAFVARVTIVNIFGGCQRIINIFKIKIIVVKLSLFHYLNNAKHKGLFEVTNILQKNLEKRAITYPFFKLCHVYHQDIFKAVCKENLRRAALKLI